MEFANYMEEAVREILDGIIENRSGICRCGRCRTDMVALALNRLPARYVVTDKGRAYTKLEAAKVQFAVDITKELAKAMDVVKANPRH